jgi:hypothetical protein
MDRNDQIRVLEKDSFTVPYLNIILCSLDTAGEELRGGGGFHNWELIMQQVEKKGIWVLLVKQCETGACMVIFQSRDM